MFKVLLFMFIAQFTTNDLYWKARICTEIGHTASIRSFPTIADDLHRECGRCQHPS